MKIKLNSQLKASNGKDPLLNVEGMEMTLREVCIHALLSPDNKDTRERKWKKYELYKEIRDAVDEVDLVSDKITLIKELFAQFHSQLVMGQCFEIIEPEK